MRKGGRFLAPQPDKKGKTWLTVLVILLAVVLLVGAIGAGFVVSKLNRIQRAQRGDNNLSADDLSGLLVDDPKQQLPRSPSPQTRITGKRARSSMCC